MNEKCAKYAGRLDRDPRVMTTSRPGYLKHREWAAMPYDYIDCEVHNDCLACPLSICKWDDLSWFHRSVRMGRWYAMAEMRLGGAFAEDTAAVFGVTVRTVYGSIAKVNKASISPGDRAVFARLARNLPEALRTEPPLPRARPWLRCGEDISERDYRAKLCHRCGEARNPEKNRRPKSSVRVVPSAHYVPASDPVLHDRYLACSDLSFNFEMGLE